ncbi:MAG: ubiquinone biosynthesis protein UbiB [Hyphomonas sp. 34-62-18]|nr:AarF/UbiB family protein [Hyphomonas sp. 34-62-18]OZB19185.1 MAG: ubiquinone biosynthesis protein UbiB [Hyphomonas sp. 34-62-18]
MGVFSDYRRLFRAGTSLARHDVVLPGEYQSRLPLPARIAGGVLRLFGGGAKGRPGERLAYALERLGPAYIKLGQFLATRPDVFGSEVAGDLARLKDKLPPFPMKQARAALAAEFGAAEAQRLFPNLSEPVAAASLAQVHRMPMPDGDRAVKILRPGIERQLMLELSAMRRAARTIEGVSTESRRLKPVAFTETIASAMLRETDLRLEAGGADEMREVYEKTGFFRVPKVDWERTGKRVMTAEWIEGTPLTAPGVLDQPGIDRKQLANDITQGFLASAINYGVFHADMHEGNAILTPEGKIALVDFGIIGRIGNIERRFLAEILWGFLKRDYVRIAEVHFEAGYVPPSQSVGDFAQALRSIGEPLFGRPAEEVSMGRVLLQLFDYTHTFGMALRPELVLLQKTMVQVEGVARTIDPSHNIWNASEPVIEAWMRRNFGPEGAARLISENVREVTNRLKRLPEVMDRFERSLNVEPLPPPPRERFAPWWGWFGLVLGLSAIVAWVIHQVS